MHELSVALDLISLTEGEAKAAGATRIVMVKVIIGHLSGIDFESFTFMLDLARKKSLLEEAVISYQRIFGKGKCLSCLHEFPVSDHLVVCPRCKSLFVEIAGGDELRIDSIIVE
jgi:hydrogenase nickel incorporation protein HypA/HybF